MPGTVELTSIATRGYSEDSALGDPFDADRCGADQSGRTMMAGLGIAHADVMAVDHVGDQLLG